MLNVSSVLCDDMRPESIADVLSACLEKTCSPLYKHAGGFRFGIGLVDDVVSVLSLGGNAIVCLLCDVQRMMNAGEKMLKREKRKGEMSRRLRNADRKVYFILCWVHEQVEDVWSSLVNMLEIERASVLDVSQGGAKPGKFEGKGLNQNKPVIEEML